MSTLVPRISRSCCCMSRTWLLSFTALNFPFAPPPSNGIVQIGSLDVLNDGDFADPLVVQLDDSAENLGEPGLTGRQQPPFTGDQLVGALESSDQQRLQDAMLADALDHFAERRLVELL